MPKLTKVTRPSCVAKAFRPKKPLRRLKGPDNGVSKTFSTVGEQQYNTIGKFWDEMSAIYGLENLRGLGYNWKDDSIEYVIGLKNNEIFDVSDAGVWKEVSLPDSGWKTYSGTTERLGAMYDEIYKEGRLTYEIEEFFEDGSCKVMITR